MIDFNQNAGNTVGYMGMRRLDNVYVGNHVTTTGYPSAVNGQSSGLRMYSSGGNVTEILSDNIRFNNDVSGGNSGGPIHIGDIAVGIVAKRSSAGNFGSGYSCFLFDFFLDYG